MGKRQRAGPTLVLLAIVAMLFWAVPSFAITSNATAESPAISVTPDSTATNALETPQATVITEALNNSAHVLAVTIRNSSANTVSSTKTAQKANTSATAFNYIPAVTALAVKANDKPVSNAEEALAEAKELATAPIFTNTFNQSEAPRMRSENDGQEGRASSG